MRLPRFSVFLFVLVAFLLAAAGRSCLGADDQKVESKAKEPKGWIGQRIPFFVDLRGPGPFVGTASFSIPRVPRVVIVKVGSPVVSSEEDDDKTIFTQTHEFALFSQAVGEVKLPPFEVRYTNKDGYTGPEFSTTEKVPALEFDIQKPDGLPDGAFVVTTEQFNVTESWDAKPATAEVGDVFHRTITQTADQMTGMALAPPPTNVPEELRVYPGDPEVTDKTERGELSGKRIDKITYSIRKPGTMTIPAIEYVWWNPEKEEFGSKTLPAVTFQVAAPPKVESTAKEAPSRTMWAVAIVAAIAGLTLWQRKQLIELLRQVHQKLNPPAKVAARQLMKACRQNDSHSAEVAWASWINTQPDDLQLPDNLRKAVNQLHAIRYGNPAQTTWDGHRLGIEFHQFMKVKRDSRDGEVSRLPPLNAN